MTNSMLMTKSQINKLGKDIKKQLKKEEKPDTELLDKLQLYRSSFKDDLSSIFTKISKIAKENRSDSILSFRIKRIESILSKIKRQPTMSLGNMGDIAGCRIIVYNDTIFPNIIRSLHDNFNVKDIKDYLFEPKKDGYKGYHIYIQSPINENKLIEIQLRTIESHKWASMVEILDILLEKKIKEGEKNEDLEQFHLLLSNKQNLSIEEVKQLIEIDKKYNIYGRLNQAFIKNNFLIRQFWLKTEVSSENHFIIEVDENKKSSIVAYPSYEIAENKYFEKFKTNKGSNFVLTKIEKPNFKRLCIAYASYVLVRHDYINDWDDFLNQLITQSKREENQIEHKKYKEYLKQAFTKQLILLKEELFEITKYIEKNEHKNSESIKEWADEILEKEEYLNRILLDISKEDPKINAFTIFIFWLKKLFGLKTQK